MTANQRRPGFRLPWSSGEEEQHSNGTTAGQAGAATPEAIGGEESWPARDDEQTAHATDAAPQPTPESPQEPASVEPGPAEAATAEAAPLEPAPVEPAAGEPAPVEATDVEGPSEFLRELVTAMRRVADEARSAGIEELRARAEDEVKRVEIDAERRREDLRARADSEIAGVGEWAKAEAERIRREAEQRVAARRSQLEQELSAEATRGEAETQAVRHRVAEYERELDAYHAQLSEITDPAAFAAAAKRMPKPPRLGAPPAAASANGSVGTASTNGTTAEHEIHPAEEEVLAARLAELDVALEPETGSSTQTASATAPNEPVTTEVVVNGLGSFGAITGFRQALAGADGIEGVALSLGQGGEFVFRATHPAGVDVGSKIAEMEGERAHIETRPEGGLRVKLDRSR